MATTYTTYTANLRLPKPGTSDRAWDVPLNAASDLIDGLAPIASLAVTPTDTPSTTLAVRATPGKFRRSDGTPGVFAGLSAVALPASAATRLWLADDGTLNQGTAYPATPYVPLAIVTTDAGTVVGVVDDRVAACSLGIGSSGSGSAGASYLVAQPESGLSAERVLTGTPNQVLVADHPETNQFYLALPQDVAPTSSPTFAGLALTGRVTLHGVRLSIMGVSASMTAASVDVVAVDASSGSVTIMLPAPSSSVGVQVRVKKTDTSANAVTIATPAGTIDGQATLVLTDPYATATLIGGADGATWGVY